MLIIGTLGAIIAGLFVPTIALIMGTIAGKFGDSSSADDMAQTIA